MMVLAVAVEVILKVYAAFPANCVARCLVVAWMPFLEYC